MICESLNFNSHNKCDLMATESQGLAISLSYVLTPISQADILTYFAHSAVWRWTSLCLVPLRDNKLLSQGLSANIISVTY